MTKIGCRFEAKAGQLSKSRSALLLAVLASAGVVFLTSCLPQQQRERQAMVHEMGHQVMPFELSKTRHIFEMTESGGILRVIVKDLSDKEQISLIQEHLQHLATGFRAGDFSDPASLHGADMPGLRELAAGAARIKIEYVPLPNGGQITFTTDELHLITAIHRWFGAQLSDHGADATYR